MFYTARRQVLSFETRTPTLIFLSCPSLLTPLGGDVIFLTCQGCEGKQPPRNVQDTPSKPQNSPQNRLAGQGQSIHTPNGSQAVRGANKTRTGLGEEQTHHGTHQPHSQPSPPALAGKTHHPSPTARPNHLSTLRSHHHLGHT